MPRRENNQFSDANPFIVANQARQKLIQTSLDGFCMVRSSNARIVETNEAFCNMVGYSREELLAMSIHDLEANESPVDTAVHIRKVVDAGHDRFETRHRHKQGHLIELEVSVSHSTMNGGMIFAFFRNISERKRTEDALYFIAQRGWMGGSENFFGALAQYLGEALGVDYVVIDRLKDSSMTETVALYARREIVPNLSYGLKGTPCENVMGREFCFYARDVQQQFPEDKLLAEMGAESYAGIPLWDSGGQPIGLIAVMDSKPLSDEGWISRLLQLVAIRAAAELERERTDRILQKNEREFRSLAENSPDNIVRYDREGRIVYLNPVLEKTLGIAAADMIGKHTREIHPDGSYEAYAQTIENTLASGEDGEIDLTFSEDRDGIRIHHVRMVAERDEKGEVAGVLAIGRDITERKHMEQIIAAREREFRSLAENSPDNIVCYDRQCRVQYANPALLTSLSPKFMPVLGESPAETFPDNDGIVEYQQRLACVMATGGGADLVAQVPNLHGEMRTHHIRYVARRDAAGEITGALAIGRDVTDLKRMEQAVAAREQEFRSLAESSPDSIVRFDRDGRYLYLNDRLVKHLELESAKEVIGKRPGEVWTDGRFAELERAVARAADSGNQVDIELLQPTGKGAFRCHQIFVVPERDVGGQIVGTIAFGREITVIREAERRLKHFIENSPGMAYTYRLSPDGHTCFPFISPSIEKFYGLKPEDVRDDIAPLHRFWHTDDRPHIEAAATEAARTMTPFRIEARVCRPGQPERWIEARALPEREADGSILWYGLLLDITERIEAQQQMALLERAINQSSDAIFLIDEDIRFTYVNEAACRSLGYSREELLKLTPPDIDPDRTREMVVALMRNGTEKGSVFEARQQAKDGRIFPVELSGVTFKRDSRAFSLVTARDITERKQTEALLKERLRQIGELNRNLEENARSLRAQTEELAASQEQLKQTEAWYRSILHSAPDGMVVTDEHGVIVLANAQAERIFGYAPGELAGLPVERLVPPGKRERHVTMRADFDIATGGNYPKSKKARGLTGYRKDGKELPLDLSLSRLPDTDDHAGHVCAAMRDITERKQAEDALRTSEERMRLFFERQLVGMAISSPEKTWLKVNDKLCEMLGYEREELLRATWAELTHPEDLAANVAQFERMLGGEIDSYTQEKRFVRKDGGIVFVALAVGCVRRDDRSVDYTLALLEDITERKEMEQERINHSKRLEEVSRSLVAAQEHARRRLASELHDRTSPNLAAIDINLNVIASEVAHGASTDLTERMEDIRALISDTAASIREIGTEMHPPLLDYAGLSAAMEYHALLFARRTGIRVDFECKNKNARYSPQIESLLFRIFQEALTNSSKHSSARSIRISLCSDITPNVLTIADDGAGFNPAQLGKTGKIGLGLLNMREMAEVAGVKIAIESAIGKGTCITVEI